MDDEEAKALGRRLAACEGFRPLRGMRDFDGRTWPPDLLFRWKDGVDVPDLRDPATFGCALSLAREAHADPYLCIVGDPETGWRADAVTANVADLHGFASEAEALVAALEQKP